MIVRLTEAAEADITGAMIWYERQREGLGEEFRGALRDLIAMIGANPELFGLYEGGGTSQEYRRAIEKRFSYVVLFQIHPEEIVVHAVVHGSREPGHWERR